MTNAVYCLKFPLNSVQTCLPCARLYPPVPSIMPWLTKYLSMLIKNCWMIKGSNGLMNTWRVKFSTVKERISLQTVKMGKLKAGIHVKFSREAWEELGLTLKRGEFKLRRGGKGSGGLGWKYAAGFGKPEERRPSSLGAAGKGARKGAEGFRRGAKTWQGRRPRIPLFPGDGEVAGRK